MTSQETLHELQGALADVKAKKEKKDELSRDLSFATNQYTDSLNKVNELRANLNRVLGEELVEAGIEAPSRLVKVSG